MITVIIVLNYYNPYVNPVSQKNVTVKFFMKTTFNKGKICSCFYSVYYYITCNMIRIPDNMQVNARCSLLIPSLYNTCE